MSDRDAFLRAIHANPDDDAPRLVYSDWLEENGQEDRAEFIRISLAMSSEFAAHGHSKRHDDLFVQHRAIFAREWSAVLTPFGAATICDYRRGLYTGFYRLHAAEVPSALPMLVGWFGSTPSLTIKKCLGAMQDMAATPALAWITTISLGMYPLEEILDADVQAFCESPHLAGLRELNIRGSLGPGMRPLTDRTAIAVAEAATLRNLKQLSFSNFELGVPAVRALVASKNFEGLEYLVCSLGRVGPKWTKAFRARFEQPLQNSLLRWQGWQGLKSLPPTGV